MKVEVWSDFVCPFCYMGERKFELGLEQFEHKDEVEVEFKSFELNTQAKKEEGKNIHQIIADKYGIGYEQAKANNDQIKAAAQAVGLHYDFDKMTPNNTFLAHQIFQYAKSVGKGKEVAAEFFKAYFEDGMDIGDREKLFEKAAKAGLDKDQLSKALKDNKVQMDVRKEEAQANELGIGGVPYFLIDGKYAVSGAQDPSLFLKALRQAYEGK